MGTVYTDKLDPQSGNTLEIGTSGDTVNVGATTVSVAATGNTALTIDSSGHITKPLQSAFSVPLGSTVSNVTGDNTDYNLNTAIWGTEIFDRNADLAATGIFTAPVAGLYQLNFQWEFYSIASVHTRGIITIKTSNRNYGMQINPYLVMEGSGNTDLSMTLTCLADMDAADTAYTSIKVFGNSKVIDLNGAASNWSGILIA